VDFFPQQTTGAQINDFTPQRPLSIAARQVWDAHAARIHREGRWSTVDHDLLCLYAETVVLYLRFKVDVDEHGTLVVGRSAQERVRNPSLMGLAQARTDSIRLAKAIPLVDPKPRQDGIEVDRLLEEIMR
jgi:phage terminase small subunit